MSILMLIQVGISCKWTNDSKLLLFGYFDTIRNSPSQIYCSILQLCPSSSWLWKCYGVEPSLRVKAVEGELAEWGISFCSVSSGKHTQALSYCSNILAIGCDSGGIIILDVISGRQIAFLSSHSLWVRSLEFSSDGRSLVSGSDDKAVKLWDVPTGGVIKTFYGHTTPICSVAISVDYTRIISGSGSGIIHVWDVQSGRCICTIGQEGFIHYVGFFPASSGYTISVCNQNIQQWDPNSHQILSTFNGSNIAFSADHTQFAFCNGCVITVQNHDSGRIVAELCIPHGTIKQCCFSPDGGLVAAISGITGYVWDLTCPDPCLIKTLCGHSETITALVFSSSSSLISMSGNGFLVFWQIDALSPGAEIVISCDQVSYCDVKIQVKC